MLSSEASRPQAQEVWFMERAALPYARKVRGAFRKWATVHRRLLRHQPCGREGRVDPHLLRRQADCGDSVSLSLCDEVQRAAAMLLCHPSSANFNELYKDRRNPEFSRLSALLSFSEAELLTSVKEAMDDLLEVYIFDGGYVRCGTMEEELRLTEACAHCERSIQCK